jgi:hypothetical protein
LEALPDDGVPAVLFATDGNGSGLAVSDLNGGFRATYPAGRHVLGPGATTDAVLTRDQLIVWRADERALVLPAGRLADGRHELVDGGLRGPGREIGTLIGQRSIVATDSGDAVWIAGGCMPSACLSPATATGGDDVDTPLELVDLETGAVRASTTVPPNSRLVDTIGEHAVVGSVTGAEMLVVSPAGDTSPLEPPEPAQFLTATPTHTVWIAGSGRLLVVTDDEEVSSIPEPTRGDWLGTGAPTIPSSSPTFPTVSSDGTRLLVALSDPNGDPVNGGDDQRLAVVDLDDGTTELVYEGPGAASAYWAGDDRTAVVAGGDEPSRTVTAVDTVTGATRTIADAVPEGYFVVAAH